MTKDEVRKLINTEFPEQLKKYGVKIDEIPIQIQQEALSKGDFENSASILQFLGRVKEGCVFLAKRGAKFVSIIFILAKLYSPFVEFIGELIVPNSMPDVKKIAAITREGIIEGYDYLTAHERHEPETFIAFNNKWEAYKPEDYTRYTDRLRGSTMEDFVYQIDDPMDWQFIPASGVGSDFLSASTNVFISPSASSSASPSPEDTEEA
jgi:hypothetical protein